MSVIYLLVFNATVTIRKSRYLIYRLQMDSLTFSDIKRYRSSIEIYKKYEKLNILNCKTGVNRYLCTTNGLLNHIDI
jgi:hypothetical protein